MTPKSSARWLLAVAAVAALTPAVWPQRGDGPVRVTIRDEQKTEEAPEVVLPVDPQPRASIRPFGNMNFCPLLDNKQVTFGQGPIQTALRIDNQMMYPANAQQLALPQRPGGRPRSGYMQTFVHDRLHFTQTVELITSKPSGKVVPGQKRRLDTILVRYSVVNKDGRPRKVAVRISFDVFLVNNDGALFASPVTHPGQILNGVELKGKTLPPYFQILQVPNIQNPGFVAYFTLKMSKSLEPPTRVVLTNLGTFGGGWDIPAQPAGDSAMAMYWDDKDLQPGGKRELVYALGEGVASNPENEGRVQVALGGSFEPNKLFTVSAYVEDPLPGQTLTLELPKGMERVEGKELQPVPPPGDEGAGLVLWKARVLETGTFPLRVRSSNGLTTTKHITISRAN
jgi:hypothetical protein